MDIPIEPISIVHEGLIYVTEDLLNDKDVWEWVKSELLLMYGEQALHMVRIVKRPEVITLTAEQTQKLMAGVCALSTHSWNKTRKSRWRCFVCNKVRKVRKRRRKKDEFAPIEDTLRLIL